MKLFKTIVSAGLLGLSTLGLATPTELVTENTTDVWSNARIGGIYSPHPTKPHDTNVVSWWSVRLACFGHTNANNKCEAEIVVDTKGEHPISLGNVELDLDTGDITPSILEKDGYRMEVTGEARSRLSKID